MTVRRTVVNVRDCMVEFRVTRTFEELLLELRLCDLDLDGLVDLLVVAALVVCVVFDRRGEEGVDECGLSEARLASNLRSAVSIWPASVVGGGIPLS